jgi:hypothetical protein
VAWRRGEVDFRAATSGGGAGRSPSAMRAP